MKSENLRPILKATVLIILLTNFITFSQTDTKKLENSVKSQIGAYYDEDIGVSADKNGTITLSGEVNTLFDKLKIGELISRDNGVKDVINNITVHNEITADNIIRANIENELQRNDAILEPNRINVEVKDGVVTLSGTVSYFREKLMAQSIASWQDGVSDMKSSIKVLSPGIAKSDENLKIIIDGILKRDFPSEKYIKFDVSNGEVSLWGNTLNLYAKNHIPEEIQKVLGVKSVINEMSVNRNIES